LTIPEIIGLVASLVSLIIGGFAVWLSVTFYRLSQKNSQQLENSSKNIDSKVNRLEGLFDKLYSDTFGMMKDTVQDMSKHAWHLSELNLKKTPKPNDEALNELKVEINQSIEELKQNQGSSNKQFESFAAKIESLVVEKIDDSAKKLTSNSWDEMETTVINALQNENKLTTRQLRNMLNTNDDEESASLLFIMNHNKQITWPGTKTSFNDSTVVELAA